MRYSPPILIVDHARKWVWHQVPKVASMPILLAIRDAWQVVDHLDVIAQNRVSLESAAELNGYFRFGFVRDPFARAYSCWLDKVQAPVERGTPFLFRHFATMHAGQPFREWLSAVAMVPDACADPHFASQTALLTIGPRLVPDFVGRFERFADDWETIAPRLGLPSTLPHLPVFSQRPPADHKWHEAAYDDQTRGLVRQRYWADLERFGYV